MSQAAPTWIIDVYLSPEQSHLEHRIGDLAAQHGGRFDFRDETLNDSGAAVRKHVELTYEFDDMATAQQALEQIVSQEKVHVEGPAPYG